MSQTFSNLDRIAALPLWAGTPKLAPLTGGLSNTSYLAEDAGCRYVVRLTRDFPFHQVSRRRELAAGRAAHAAGFAPEIVHAEPGLMVTRYIAGEVLDAAAVRHRTADIARLLRAFHARMPQHFDWPGFRFDVFAVNRDYFAQLADSVPAPQLRRWAAINDEMQALQLAMPLVVAHHDLLPANLIDDGSRLWLIDYEYTGAGNPLFDLANLTSNAGFMPDAAAALLEVYFDGPPAAALLRAHAAMEIASLLREGLWSLVSERHLDAPGADYAGYARATLARFDAACSAWRERFDLVQSTTEA